MPITCLKDFVNGVSAPLIEDGKLEVGEIFTYRVLAYGDSSSATTSSSLQEDAAPAFAVEKVINPLPIGESSLREFVARSKYCGPPHAGEPAVFIPESVFLKAEELKMRAGANETAGVLIGHLHADASGPDVFVEVTAQITAEHLRPAATRLTFTADTWTAVPAAMAPRARRRDTVKS